MLIESCPYEVLPLHPDTMSSTSCSVTGCIYIDCDTFLFTKSMGFVPGQGFIRFDKLVPVNKEFVEMVSYFFTFQYYSIFTNTKFVGIFCFRFVLPILLLRIFHVLY